MIKALCSLPAPLLPIFLGSLLLLNACTTPALTGPSVALKQQFAQLQQQQQLQAAQIEQLQQQLQRLQPQPSAPPLTVSEKPAPVEPMVSVVEPKMIPATISQEISILADSASSYLAAFSNLAAGRFAAAETGFDNFLESYPQHQYSPNARYWLASAQASQGKLQSATSNLRQIIIDNQGQKRAPAALALLAKIYQQQQLTDEAEEMLQQLISRYPESSEAQQMFKTTEHQP